MTLPKTKLSSSVYLNEKPMGKSSRLIHETTPFGLITITDQHDRGFGSITRARAIDSTDGLRKSTNVVRGALPVKSTTAIPSDRILMSRENNITSNLTRIEQGNSNFYSRAISPRDIQKSTILHMEGAKSTTMLRNIVELTDSNTRQPISSSDHRAAVNAPLRFYHGDVVLVNRNPPQTQFAAKILSTPTKPVTEPPLIKKRNAWGKDIYARP